MLLLLLYGYESCSLILKEEHRLEAFENRMLRRVLFLQKDGTIGGWRKLHNGDLHHF
jgi:hypothetical protein